MVIRDQLVFFTSSEDLAFLPDESVTFEREELPVRHELTLARADSGNEAQGAPDR
jgi:hypothetical protein